LHEDLLVQLDYLLQFVEQGNKVYYIVNENHNPQNLVHDVNLLYVNLQVDLLLQQTSVLEGLVHHLDYLEHHGHYMHLH
jgi:hypothetical protein